MNNGPLSDFEIEHYEIITPCVKKQSMILVGDKTFKLPSWGLQSYGYDVRLNPDEFCVFSNAYGATIDPRNFDEGKLLLQMKPQLDEDGLRFFIVPPNGTALGVTRETFNVPNNVIGQVFGKSTYSRCGLVINCTLLEPGWRGELVIELHNASPMPIKVYSDGGISQIVFLRGDHCSATYNGKYQDQKGLVKARS